jgi:zinc/manganese transport system substrate-binding protein
MRMRIILILLLAPAVTACGSARTGGTPTVVAAENVYGDIAAQIAGGRVAVTSILTDPNADPHLFEPGTANGLAVAHARVVIQNGLGYDAFMTKLENAAPSSSRVTVTVADALGVHGGGANPHLWYDVPRLPRIAAAIERALERALPRETAAFRAGLSRFDERLAPLDAEVAAIRAAHAGERVAYTESVPGYLLAAAGLRNVAPHAFTQAIEDGSEPPPSAVADMLDLMRSGKARVLLYNTQAVSPITSRVREAAGAARIPVVGVSETLPSGLHFQAWQLRQARALGAALDG